MGAGETILEARRGGTVRIGTIFWREGYRRGVTVRVVITVVDITLGEIDITVGTLVVTVEEEWFVTVVGIGVARISCALGQEMFLRPSSTKIA